MSGLIDLTTVEDLQETVHRAARMLVEDGVVALPDDCGLAICALATRPAAVRRLAELLPHWKTGLPALSLADRDQIGDFVAESVPLSKLTERCWPGPLHLQTPLQPHKLGAALPAETLAWGQGPEAHWLTFANPAHDFQRKVLQLLPAPLASLVIPTFGVSPTTPIGGADVTLVEGPPRFDGSPTVIRLDGEDWQVVQEGVYSERLLRQQLSDVFLFVCTGNTCRSPMAEALFRRMVAERMHCRDEELAQHGVLVTSAGLSTRGGSPASRETAQLLLDEHNIDLRDHASQPVTQELLFRADLIVTMTAAHRDAILATFPELAAKTRVLAWDGADVSDPYGGDMEEYRHCRDQIQNHLRHLVDELDAHPEQ